MFLRTINKNRVNIDRDLKKDMRKVSSNECILGNTFNTYRRTLFHRMTCFCRQMMELKHTNLNMFYGACVDPPHMYSVWEHCPKGSLQDVICNETIKLDDMFKFSICVDVVKVRPKSD